jgi:6-phosphogluconolactonase (cycloisomerase 2 family)
MQYKTMILGGLAALAVSGAVLQGEVASSAPNQPGFIYAMTNLASGNSIAIFRQAETGMLSPAGVVATGGLGFETGQPDPLASQGSLIADGRQLFAVNAGSDDFSVLQAEGAELRVVAKVSSGGVRPTSLTVRRGLLYVQNAGSGTIAGFRVEPDGRARSLPDSRRELSGGPASDPAQASFTPDGRFLLVTGKATNLIDLFRVERSGRTRGPEATPSNGTTPFGYGFDEHGNVIVSEAFGGVPNAGAMSSYALRDGGLEVISGSVPNNQTASCWVVITSDGAYAYTTNTGSASISSYRIGSDGSLELLEPVAGQTTPGGAPIDMTLDRSGSFLYVLVGGTGTISAFRINDDGSLTHLQDQGGLPPGAQGITAR